MRSDVLASRRAKNHRALVALFREYFSGQGVDISPLNKIARGISKDGKFLAEQAAMAEVLRANLPARAETPEEPLDPDLEPGTGEAGEGSETPEGEANETPEGDEKPADEQPVEGETGANAFEPTVIMPPLEGAAPAEAKPSATQAKKGTAKK